MDDALLQFCLPRVVAAIIDVEHVPKFARDAGVRDLRFKYSSVGQAVCVTCSRELAANLLENLQRRLRSRVLPVKHLPEYIDAVARVQQALGVLTNGESQLPASEAADILLVEDDATVRGAVRRMLDDSPHQVREAASGYEALETFRKREARFDLVITDMVMPTMTGAELVRELRKWNPLLPAIVMSGDSEEPTTRDGRLPANCALIEKPVCPQRLLVAVSGALGTARD
jgi:CheY-like chemotaxis protein